MTKYTETETETGYGRESEERGTDIAVACATTTNRDFQSWLVRFWVRFWVLEFFLNKKWVQGGFTHLLLHQEKGGCVFGVFGFEMHL
jgi:hypothetical protein